MVSAVAILPVLLTLFAGLGLVFFMMKRKSLAQSICIQQAAQIQQDLKKPLRQLLKLNEKAEALRSRRANADTEVALAAASLQPHAIAIAKAKQHALILEQTALHSQQLQILADAERLRQQGQRELRRRVRLLGVAHAEAPMFYSLPLAVEPRPAGSPSPDYVPIAAFNEGQQQRFRFQLDVLSGLPLPLPVEARDRMECSVTLDKKEDQWEFRVLQAAAKPPSN